MATPPARPRVGPAALFGGLAAVGAVGAFVAFLLDALPVALGFAVVAASAAFGFLGSRVQSAIPGSDASPNEVTQQDLRELIREGVASGSLATSEKDLLESVLKFTNTEVRHVMSPRPKISAIALAWPPDEVLRYAAENKFSRYPVYDKGLNDVVGFLYYKDLLPVLHEKQPLDLRAILRPPFFVPETMKLGTLLKDMQRRRVELAIVVNEHGNVEGIVTLEDLLEEIVGEIQDEYDVEEKRVERLRDGSWLVDASLLVSEMPPELAGLVPKEDGYETVAGYALATIQRLPRIGEAWEAHGWRVTVVEMEGRRIARLKVQRI